MNKDGITFVPFSRFRSLKHVKVSFPEDWKRYKHKYYRTALYHDGDIHEQYNKILLLKSDTSSLKSYIIRFGEEHGKIKFNIKNKLTSGSLESYILRYGSELGKQKWDNFRLKIQNSSSKESYISKYGEELGSIEWKNY